MIVGFPGETDEDFEDTLDVIRRVEFDNVLCSYIPRIGTLPLKWKILQAMRKTQEF